MDNDALDAAFLKLLADGRISVAADGTPDVALDFSDPRTESDWAEWVALQKLSGGRGDAAGSGSRSPLRAVGERMLREG